MDSKRNQLKQFLESKKGRIYPPPDAQVIKSRCKRPTRSAPETVLKVTLNAQPVEEENAARVMSSDERTRVLDTAKWPFSIHGVVTCKFGNTTCWGTGTLIGPNVVLTAGHMLYDHRRRVYVDLKSLRFLPAMNGQVIPFGVAEVEMYFVSPNYVKEQKEDYGILILREPIGEMTGYFGLACLEPEELRGKRINITGYPSDKVISKPNCYEMWGTEGEVSSINQHRGIINYFIDTGPGQTGGGVWYQEGEDCYGRDYYVCGVHISGTQIVNKATLLTRAIYGQIYNWLHQGSNSKWLNPLDSIEKLEFENFQIDAEQLSLLVEYDLEGLTTLSLISKKIEPTGAEILARNTSWINLSKLDLYNNQIGPKGCQALARNSSWINLSSLNLNRNNIGTEGAITLAKNQSWRNISKLSLESNNIEPEGAMALAKNSSWKKLLWLSLKNNLIGTEGAKAFAENSYWNSLRFLDLRDNEVENEEETANLLKQNPNWPSLEFLEL